MYGVIKATPILASGNRSSRPMPYVASVTGLHSKYGLSRKFLKALYDYSHAAKSGKGVVMYWFIPPGLYEVFYPTSWKHERRYFVEVLESGDVIEISKEKVIECLKKSILE